MNYKCPVHLTPLSNAVVCKVCIADLSRNLGDVAALAGELEITSTRQNVGGARNGSRSTSTPLPYDWSADHDLDDLNATLTGWVRDLIEAGDDWPTGATKPQQCTAMSRWLLARTNLIAQHLAADAICDEISYAVKQSYRAIDRQVDRWYAGPCRAEYVANPDDSTEDNDACCLVDLYAKPGAELLTCPHCQSIHRCDERRSWLLAAAEDTLATATTIAGAVSVLAQRVTPERIRKWAERGRISAKGVNHRGHPTYRVGDVIDRLQEDIESTQRRTTRHKTAAA